MRLTGAFFRLAAMVALLMGAVAMARAQDTQVMMPDQSAQKAKDILQQTIQALGGSAYLNLQDSTCEGRLSAFGHSGDLTHFDVFLDISKMPDKDRTEHSKKRNIIEVFNGNQGWVLDQAGVSDAPAGEIADFQKELKTDLDHILRYRLNEKGMTFRYSGPDVVDLKEADWVELVDSEGHTFRIAIAKITHLPIRKEVISRDPTTQLRSEEVEYYTNFEPIQGIETPFQITRTRNGIKVFQVFFNSCAYNTGVQDSIFTRQSLEERAGQVLKKKKK